MNNRNKPLLMEVNRIFNTLEYDYSSGFDHREFYKAAIKTLNRCASIDDSVIIIDAILHFQVLHNDFVKMLEDGECLSFFLSLNMMPIKVNLLDKPVENVYTVTNALIPDYRKYFVLNSSFDGNHICYISNFRTIKTYTYYAKLNSHLYEIYDKKDRHLFSLHMSHNVLKLIDNDCKAEMIHEGKNLVNVYHKDVVKSSKNDKKERFKNALASYQYKKIKHINKLGIVRYQLIDKEADKELLDLIAIGYLALSRI